MVSVSETLNYDPLIRKKNKEEKKKMRNKKGNLLIGILIAVIMGVVMLGVINTMVTDKTNQFTGSQDLINYTTTGVNVLLTSPNDDFQEVAYTTTIKNTTSDLTSVCNISVDRNLLCSVNSSVSGGLINVSYEYLKTGYYTGATTRTIGNILPIFLAVGLISVIVLLYRKD